ncbi:MAG: hypothetical protein NC417_02150 [Candidatus Gastranaerophilales bacterium]|nr:hypothetical protein [Candidatus Gastranaerophilales bacterium]
MRFDRLAPGGGMEIFTKLENGKAVLEFAFYLETEGEELKGACADLYLYDREGCCVLRLTHPLRSEELARGILLHPHLWNSVEDPYFYRAEVFLMMKAEGKAAVCDHLERALPLCTLRKSPAGDWFLNERSFALRAVGYAIPRKGEGEERKAALVQDMQKVKELGANAVCLSGGKLETDFYELCCRQGFVVLCAHGKAAPCVTLEELLNVHRLPTDTYYYYKALWSKVPFVYLNGDSLIRQKNGLYQVKAYSNLKKVALYVEGVHFEFQSGAPEFLFSDVEIRRFPAALTVEADACSMSATVYFSRNS